MSEPDDTSTLPPYPVLPSGMELHVCLTCGVVVPHKGVGIHETWHSNVSRASLDAHRRLDLIEEVS